MQAQDASELVVFRLWPWIEENWRRLAVGAGAIFAVVMVYLFVSYRHQQNEIAAGQAMTQALVSQPQGTTPSEMANALLKVAQDYPGTAASARAQLQSAATLFEAGQYADAQTQFQKFLDTNPDSSFKATAMLGVAASLEAQGKGDLALALYKKITGLSNAFAMLDAKFAIARITEQSGKLDDALNYYEDVAHSGANTEFGSEAGLKVEEIKAKLFAVKAKPTTTSKH